MISYDATRQQYFGCIHIAVSAITYKELLGLGPNIILYCGVSVCRAVGYL